MLTVVVSSLILGYLAGVKFGRHYPLPPAARRAVARAQHNGYLYQR